jgi:hypothetical protein
MHNLQENIAIFVLLTCALRAHVNISLFNFTEEGRKKRNFLIHKGSMQL